MNIWHQFAINCDGFSNLLWSVIQRRFPVSSHYIVQFLVYSFLHFWIQHHIEQTETQRVAGRFASSREQVIAHANQTFLWKYGNMKHETGSDRKCIFSKIKFKEGQWFSFLIFDNIIKKVLITISTWMGVCITF